MNKINTIHDLEVLRQKLQAYRESFRKNPDFMRRNRLPGIAIPGSSLTIFMRNW